MRLPFIGKRDAPPPATRASAGTFDIDLAGSWGRPGPSPDFYHASQLATAFNVGGVANAITGLGIPGSDHLAGTFFQRIRFEARTVLQMLNAQSWAVRKFIRLAPDESLRRWREVGEQDDDSADRDVAERLKMTESRLNVRRRMQELHKAARLFGTACMLVKTGEAPLETPLNPQTIRAGGIIDLPVVDRFAMTVEEWDEEFLSPTYGQPLLYRMFMRGRGPGTVSHSVVVHASRVIRVDGMEPLSDYGWETYDPHWGLSLLIPVLAEIVTDAATSAGVNNLVQEASMLFIKLANFRQFLAGQGNREDNPSAQARTIQYLRSIYKTYFSDKNDDVSRVEVRFAGLPDVIDRQAVRLAAACDCPVTKFWGRSPAGENSTGENDRADWAMTCDAWRSEYATASMMSLDPLLYRDAGLTMEPLPWRWRPMIEKTAEDLQEEQKREAETAKLKAEAVDIAIKAGTITADDGRMALDGDTVFGELPGAAPGLPEPAPVAQPGAGGVQG